MIEELNTLEKLGEDKFRATVAICPEGLELWLATAAPSRWNTEGKTMIPCCPNHKIDCVIKRVKISND